MGCCFSSEKKHQNHPHGSNHSHPPETTGKLENRAPPPNPEEETVKEVLPETPIPKAPVAPVVDEKKPPQIPLPSQKEEKPEGNGTDSVKHEELSEISQVSEMYSVTASETFSVSTQTTVREDEAMSGSISQVGGQRNCRSPGKVRRKRPYSGELVSGRERVAKSPARRAEPSPEKRRVQTGPRAVRGRDAGRMRNAPRNGNNVGSRVVRRDSGEASGRRSRSPATTRVGKSPAKAAEKPCERLPETEKEKKETEAKVEEGSEQQGNNSESIENPLVSLECFIFL